jgi:hypothetical protein
MLFEKNGTVWLGTNSDLIKVDDNYNIRKWSKIGENIIITIPLLVNSSVEIYSQIQIDLPASIKLQRVFRGSRGRIKAKRRALEIYSANLLQRNFAKFVRWIWTAQVIHARKLQRMATR